MTASDPRAARTRRSPLVVLVAAVVAASLGAVSLAGPAGALPTRATPSVATVAGDESPPTTTGEPADDRLPPPEPSTDEADRKADEILSDPKYDEPEPGLISRIIEWIVEQLSKLQLPGFDGGGAAAGGSSLVGWIFIAILVGVAVFLLSRLRLNRKPRDDEPDFVVETEVSRTHTEWIDEAERHEAAGQWKQALRCRFRALVASLIARGVVRDIPGRTTGEYRVEVGRNAPTVSGSFAGAAELFDRAWYGDQPTGADENQRFRALADEVVLGVEAASTPPPEPVAVGGDAGSGAAS